jgi:hypothetical protein
VNVVLEITSCIGADGFGESYIFLLGIYNVLVSLYSRDDKSAIDVDDVSRSLSILYILKLHDACASV